MEDRRDLRDPQAIGEALLKTRSYVQFKGLPLSRIQNILENDMRDLPTVDRSYSVGRDTARSYRRELQESAARGEVESARMLLQLGWALPDVMDPEIARRARETRRHEEVRGE